MLLPAETIAAITTNLAGLNLEPSTAAQILAAVFAPLLRSSDPDSDPEPKLPRKRASRPRLRARKAPRRKARIRRRYRPSEARERALAALKAHRDKTVSAVAKLAKCSRDTVIAARAELAAEVRKEARRKARAAAKAKPTTREAEKAERRERAQRFLRDALGRGPRNVSDIEAAAVKAHVDEGALAHARADLGVVTSRGNTGGAQAVQWSLPG